MDNSGVILGLLGWAMQDLGYEFPRKSIPRTPVNKGKKRISLDGREEVVAVPGSVAGGAAGTVIQCRPSSLSSVPGREESGPLARGPDSFLLAHRCPERGSTGW